jgi:hypothetical protein
MAVTSSPMNQLNSAIEQKLRGLDKSISTQELGEIHSFVKEAKGLLDTLTTIQEGPPEELIQDLFGCEIPEGYEYDETGQALLNYFVRACHLIVGLYALLDDHKIKETESDWVLEESRAFMDESREVFGYRIPALPAMRLVSKRKPKKK